MWSTWTELSQNWDGATKDIINTILSAAVVVPIVFVLAIVVWLLRINNEKVITKKKFLLICNILCRFETEVFFVTYLYKKYFSVMKCRWLHLRCFWSYAGYRRLTLLTYSTYLNPFRWHWEMTLCHQSWTYCDPRKLSSWKKNGWQTRMEIAKCIKQT